MDFCPLMMLIRGMINKIKNKSERKTIMILRIVIFTITILLTGNWALAQTLTQTVKGTVVDRESRSPLPGANVIILGTEPLKGASSDMNGRFKILNVPVGRYDIKAHYIGYDAFVMKEVMVSTGKETVVSIELKESSVAMDEIEIAAEISKDKPLNSMALASGRMLSVEEAGRYAGGFDDPARLASTTAGVAGNLNGNGIVIRGNAPKGLLWQLEGIPIANPSHFANLTTFGAGGITALSSQTLENSDFYTGAFPAEYGNASSGVFDLRMRTGNQDKREYTFQLGLMGIDAASEGPVVKGSSASYLFNYRYSTLSLLTSLLPENAGGTFYRNLSFKVNVPTNSAGAFSVWGLGANDYSGQSPEKDSAKWVYADDIQKSGYDTYMGAVGLSHRVVIGKNTFINNSWAVTGDGLKWNVREMDNNAVLQQKERIRNHAWKYTWHGFVNRKWSEKLTVKTGWIINNLNYSLNTKQAPVPGEPPAALADDKGSRFLLQCYAQGRADLSTNWTINAGFHALYFTLNKESVVEPRIGVRWKFSQQDELNLACGFHSQTELMSVYLNKRMNENGEWFRPNEKLKMAKSGHLVLGYDRSLKSNARIRIEAYTQWLYDIPIIRDSSFSIHNLDQKGWFLNEPLANSGKGRNAGIDLTYEKFLTGGYYYLFTVSLFDSRYQGGDRVKRPSRYDKHYVVNVLGGKEWNVGDGKILSVNGRINFSGGDRISPVDESSSLARRDVIYDETRAFEMRKPDLRYVDCSYKMNKPSYAMTWSLQMINMLAQSEFEGYRYNYRLQTIDRHTELTVIPNLSFKMEW